MLVATILFGLAVAANWQSVSMLVLISLVVASYFAPVDELGLTQPQFYAVCVAIELTVAAGSLLIYGGATATGDSIVQWAAGGVTTLAVLLTACHWLAYCYDGFPPESPYRWLVPSLEYLEALCCLTISKLSEKLFRLMEGKLRYTLGILFPPVKG
jgi:hypothetical protein